jgi:hypothetical protein
MDKKKNAEIGLDFIIDKQMQTQLKTWLLRQFSDWNFILQNLDLKSVTKKVWLFNWVKNLKIQLETFINLQIAGNSKLFKDFVSLEVKSDHVYMHLVEKCPLTKVKLKFMLVSCWYLVAYACNYLFNVDTMEMFSKSQLLSTEKTLEHFI